MTEAVEVYEVTTNTVDGPIVAYVKPGRHHAYVRAMREQYGDVTSVPMMMKDLPDDVAFPE